MLLVLNSQFVSPYHFRPNSGEGKPYLVVDQDQQYKITLKIEGKADLTAKGWYFTSSVFAQCFDQPSYSILT